MNDFGINLNEVEDLGSSKYDIPNGHYLCLVESIKQVYFDWGTDGSMKPGFYEYDSSMGLKDSDISYEFKIQVIDGEFTGKQLTQNIAVNAEIDVVQKIARSTIKSLFTALNVNLDTGTIKDLINKPVMIEFGHYLPKQKAGESQKPEKLTIRKIYAKDSAPVAKQEAKTENASKPGWGNQPSWSK